MKLTKTRLRLSHLTVKEITVIASLVMSLAFLLTYLGFRYFWTYDRATELVLQQQAEEISQVRTIVHLQTTHFSRMLEDFAAWDELAEYTVTPTTEFETQNLNPHFFRVAQLNAVFLFNANVSPIFTRAYDPNSQQALSFDEYRYRFGSLLADTLRSRTDVIVPVVKFIQFNDEPALMASSRICSSNGMGCNHGYAMFIRPISIEIGETLKLATGLNVTIHLREDFGEYIPSNEPNVTYIKFLDYANEPSVVFRIEHAVLLPSFITWEELGLLLLFASIMFLFAFAMVQIIVRPLKQASQMLDNFTGTQNYMPDEQDFVSYEMRHFARRITDIFKQLEANKRRLQFHAEHDALTGLANRYKLQSYWQGLSTQPFQYHLVLLFDVDFFKRYNDHYGHVQGDEVLKAVAGCLVRVPLSSKKLLARFGGEEFCAVISSDEPLDGQAIAEQYRQAIEAMGIVHEFSDIHHVLTASVGAVMFESQHIDEHQSIILQADEQLYCAKHHGRNICRTATFRNVQPDLHSEPA
ncbi:diguanylate cyclase [Vibrio sp. FNV 38]|nr:diguanylate cyclase [Vibrio sp. FNV 38]